MTPTKKTEWTDRDLERCLDAELDQATSDALRAALLSDQSLRQRLEALRERDAIALEALTQAPASAPAARKRSRAPLFAAAILLLTAAGVLIAPEIELQQQAQAPFDADRPNPSETAPKKGPNEPATRVLFEAAASPTKTAHRTPARRSQPAPTPPDPLQDALERGDPFAALDLLTAEPTEQRADDWRRLGRLMLSAEVAREMLLMLPPSRQLEALRIWADQPSLRPVAFTRLRELLEDPSTREDARRIRAELAKKPDLRPWLSSYAARTN